MRNIFDKEFVKEMDDFFDHIDGIISKDPDEVDVITDHLPEPKCGMDKLVESLREEKCCTICESAKAKGERGCGANDLSEAEYWEMKAEVHYGL